MPWVYELGVSLPDRPLDDFLAKVEGLPRKTEAERLVIQRIGQDIFRNRLVSYWQGTCHLTGITDPALLRASHIIPWKECSDDAERLNVHNGLLLSALWDAAFDKGLVTFDDGGKPVFSSILSEAARSELNCYRFDFFGPMSIGTVLIGIERNCSSRIEPFRKWRRYISLYEFHVHS